jgi:hypothetical protein
MLAVNSGPASDMSTKPTAAYPILKVAGMIRAVQPLLVNPSTEQERIHVECR